MDDEDEEKAIKSNRDPQLARMSRLLERNGSAALATEDARVEVLALLVDYACKTTHFKHLVSAWKHEEKESLQAATTAHNEWIRKRAEVERQITEEKNAIREQKIQALLTPAQPQSQLQLQPQTQVQPQSEVNEPGQPGGLPAEAAQPVQAPQHQPAPPPKIPKVTVTDDETPTLVKLHKEKENLKRQLEERREDLRVARENRAKRLSPQPLGRDRFLNSYWLFKGDEFGFFVLVESPAPWSELQATRQNTPSVSGLAQKPEWTSSSEWFIIASEEELKSIEESLSKMEPHEAALLSQIEAQRAKLLKSDHLSVARYEKQNKEPSIFDPIFRKLYGLEPAASNDESAEDIQEFIKETGTET